MKYTGFKIEGEHIIERQAEREDELSDMMFVCESNDEAQKKRIRHVLDHNIIHGEENFGGY